jgi:hypothetical protein
MLAALTASVVTLLTQMLPLIGGSSDALASIIATLVNLIPAVVQEAESLVPEVKAIIAALASNPVATSTQLQTLATLDAQVDAAFEAAAAAAGAPAAPTT